MVTKGYALSHDEVCPNTIKDRANLLDREAEQLRQKASRARKSGHLNLALKLEEAAQKSADEALELRIQRLDMLKAATPEIHLVAIDGKLV